MFAVGLDVNLPEDAGMGWLRARVVAWDAFRGGRGAALVVAEWCKEYSNCVKDVALDVIAYEEGTLEAASRRCWIEVTGSPCVRPALLRHSSFQPPRHAFPSL